ncbi:MAG: histidinol dehydrogenase, partial [Bacteroidota bacterium]
AGQRAELLKRPSEAAFGAGDTVRELCLNVKEQGDTALRKYTERFDGIRIENFCVPESAFMQAEKIVPGEFKNALAVAISNIKKFHSAQQRIPLYVETMPGVFCRREIRPIERVGMYVPAGSAPLPSTVLMLGIPAKIAGCSRIVLCSPPKASGTVDPYVLAAARAIGIDEVYCAGGAQAVAALAYGTQSIPKVDKIFGPGNRYVAAAKQFVSTDPQGAAIDMFAGPSEVFIIADSGADPEIVALDMISQAEHDPDSQAVLVTTDPKLAAQVAEILPSIAARFPRNMIVEKSLKNSFTFIADTQESALRFANDYAPEHLILNTADAELLVPFIINAGSVFVGRCTPVTAGDYASGTNHTLPTGGSARWFSGLSLESFQKTVTFQTLTQSGLQQIAPSLTAFADAEGLQAHGEAVRRRLVQK